MAAQKWKIYLLAEFSLHISEHLLTKNPTNQESQLSRFFRKIWMIFLIVFHMVWKNQESGQPWLIGFRFSRCWNMQNISASKVVFFFSFLSHHYGFTTYLEILHFLLSHVIPRVLSACRILHIATAWQILNKFLDGSYPSLHHVKF